MELKARSDKVLQDKAEAQPLNQQKARNAPNWKAKVRLLESERQNRKKASGAGKEERKPRIAKAKESLIRFSTKNKAVTGLAGNGCSEIYRCACDS